MKSVTFVRHCRLSDPYTDYNKLSLNQLRGLGTGRIDPDIHPDSFWEIAEKFTREQLQAFDMIFCAPSTRARKTAELIKRLSERDPEIEESDTLREISFDLVLLTSEEKFAREGLPEIRAALFRGMIRNEPGAEALDDLLKRVSTLTEMLEHTQRESILCITHSFYMRMLRLYFLEHLTHCQDFTADKLMNTLDHNYLEGFTLSLEGESLYAHHAGEVSVV